LKEKTNLFALHLNFHYILGIARFLHAYVIDSVDIMHFLEELCLNKFWGGEGKVGLFYLELFAENIRKERYMT